MSVVPLKLDQATNLPRRMQPGDNVDPKFLLTPTNAQTGTAYTIAPGDAGSRVTMNNAAANTVSIDATVLTPGMTGLIQQTGAGQTTVAALNGSTIVRLDGLTAKSAAQWAMLYWICDTTGQVTVGGNVAAS